MSEQNSKIRKARAKWRLCAAAEVVLARRGQDATVADILKVAGMSRRSYYEFFRSIDDMVQQMAELAASSSGFGPNAPWMSWVTVPGRGASDMAAKAFERAKNATEGHPAPVPSDALLLAWYEQAGAPGSELSADLRELDKKIEDNPANRAGEVSL